MIRRFYVRHFTPHLAGAADALASLVSNTLNVAVERVDHTNVSLRDFHLEGNMPVSIDAHLAFKFNIPYMRVSRMFNYNGDVTSRKLIIPENLPCGRDVCIIDTDSVTGSNLRKAMGAIGACSSDVLIHVGPNEELIDIEDLVLDISLLADETYCNYLINSKFFAKRTSLPEELYPEVCKLLIKYL